MTGLRWNRGRARLSKLGAMLSQLEFDLPGGRRISPLHQAPWLGESLPRTTPPILRGLSGEWPCVPFGMAPEQPLGGDWAGLGGAPDPSPDPWPHGFASNHEWEVWAPDAQTLNARITYPEGDAVDHLRRSLRGVDGQTAIDIALGIHMRRAAALPIGLHPVFRLPREVGQARLRPGEYDQVYCYPGDTGGTPAIARAPFRFDEVTTLGFDPLSLPYPGRSETLLLLSGTGGRFALENQAEGYRVTLDWDADQFPSLLLWISNGGRKAAPWNGRHWALGVEPICAAFDLGRAISAGENPLTKAGLRTAHHLTPDQPFTTRYRISVAPL